MINEEPIQEKLPARFSKKILQSIRLVGVNWYIVP